MESICEYWTTPGGGGGGGFGKMKILASQVLKTQVLIRGFFLCEMLIIMPA